MNRTQRLEAALRGLLKGIERGQLTSAEIDARAALADTSPSCCEEVRRAALEEAAQRAKSSNFVDGSLGTIEGQIAASIRALSNQAPPKVPANNPICPKCGRPMASMHDFNYRCPECSKERL